MGKDLCVKGIYGSGMVLQRDKINCIYGTGDVFSDVIMSFRGVTSITQVDENGNWKFEFSPGTAGGPFVMSIKSDAQKIEFEDIYVGEVWLNAGEGNVCHSMEEMKFSYPEEFELPENKYVRMINVPVQYSFNKKIDFVENPKWEMVSPSTLGNMSGLGYFFAKKLSVDLGVPVGIINIGAKDVPIVSWLSRTSLDEMGDKAKDLETAAFYENPENLAAAEEKVGEFDKWLDELNSSFDSCEVDLNDQSNWASCNVPGVIDDFDSCGILWLKKELELSQEAVDHFNKSGASLWLGNISCGDEVFVNGKRVGATKDVSLGRRYVVDGKNLVPGKNTILIKLLKDGKIIRFMEEKPYCLFSNDVFVPSCVSRNFGVKAQSLAPLEGEYFSLEGQWMVKVGAIVENVPCRENLVAKPTAIYNGVLPACFKYALAGVLWCQGEADVNRAWEYKGFLTKLINVWRRRFTFWSRDLPFVVVQLPNWARDGAEGELCVNSSLATIRKAQADVAGIVDKVGLVVTIDAGEWNDLYPEKKFTIGTRCEFEALRVAYGKSFISPAPKANFCEISNDKYVVKFDCGNSSLHSFEVADKTALLTKERDDGKVYGFSFLYKDSNGKELVAPGEAKLVNPNTVEVIVPDELKNMEIMELRYLWADSPCPVNLYSRDMIPVVPFVVEQK